MDVQTLTRWFGWQEALKDEFFITAGGVVMALLPIALLISFVLRSLGKIGAERFRELALRIGSWGIILAAVGLPLFFGAFWTMLGMLVLSLACYREFARLTGLFRERTVSASVVIGVFAVSFAIFDHWYGLFVAIASLGAIFIAMMAVLVDRPQAYLQRTALGIVAFLLFGFGLGHIGYVANDPGYRGYLLFLFIIVSLNDVFAYLCGSTLGHRPLAPQTSPNKTREGALGAVVLTTALTCWLGFAVFEDTPMASLGLLSLLGVLLSITGQMGDLVMSSIKRDIGVKDTGRLLPGHGGLLDRCDSLLLAGPCFFHFVGYFIGFGLGQPERLFRIPW